MIVVVMERLERKSERKIERDRKRGGGRGDTIRDMKGEKRWMKRKKK